MMSDHPLPAAYRQLAAAEKIPPPVAFGRDLSMQFNPQLVQVLKQVVTSLTLSHIISTLLSPSSVPPFYG